MPDPSTAGTPLPRPRSPQVTLLLLVVAPLAALPLAFLPRWVLFASSPVVWGALGVAYLVRRAQRARAARDARAQTE